MRVVEEVLEEITMMGETVGVKKSAKEKDGFFEGDEDGGCEPMLSAREAKGLCDP